jgi:deferrochelatase/peroxidase EfeB
MTMRDFIKANRTNLDAAILAAINRGRERNPVQSTLNDDERREWILNDEGLYRWAQSEGVRI